MSLREGQRGWPVDRGRDPRTNSFFSREEAAARIRAARAAIDRTGQGVMLVGRCKAYLMKILDLEEVIARLNAYAEAGADVVYAPGIKTLEPTAEIVRRTSRPVNANLTATGLSVQDFAKVGVRRVNVGERPGPPPYDAFDDMAELLAVEQGRLRQGHSPPILDSPPAVIEAAAIGAVDSGVGA